MTLRYRHPQTNRVLRDDSRQFSFEEGRELVASLRGSPDAYVISSLPSGAGLDLHTLDDGRVWLEFYTDTLHSATASPDIAEQVFARAYHFPSLVPTRAIFADLITEWDY